MAHQQTIPVPGRLSEAGKRVYEERLKADLEPDHIGEFVAIEPESGRYFLGEAGSNYEGERGDAREFFLPGSRGLSGGKQDWWTQYQNTDGLTISMML